jgi:hypothetical protein
MSTLSGSDIPAGLVSFVLTLMILSYLIGDNPFFRVAVYIFVGVSAGYAGAVAWYQVLQPRLFQPLLTGSLVDRALAILPLLLGVLLLMKISPRTARLGNVSMGYLVGVGAAVAVGGVVMGTLFPQVLASINMFGTSTAGGSWLEIIVLGLLTLVGTVTTLVYFHFGAKASPTGPKRNKLVGALSWVGQVYIAITFGVLFAGAFTAAMTALIERWSFILSFIRTLIGTL